MKKAQMVYGMLGGICALLIVIVVMLTLFYMLEQNLSTKMADNQRRVDAQLLSHQLVFSPGYYCGIECDYMWERHFCFSEEDYLPFGITEEPGCVLDSFENISRDLIMIGLSEPGNQYHLVPKKYLALKNLTDTNYTVARDLLGLKHDFFINVTFSQGLEIGRAPSGRAVVPVRRPVMLGKNATTLEIYLWDS